MKAVVNRFLKYISIDTQGNDAISACPSNENQRLLAELLQEELKEMGITDVCIDENSFVYTKIPSNVENELPAIAFFAHMDTTPDLPGDNIKARIIEQYQGGEIILNKGHDITLSSDEFPFLEKYKGDDLIVADGTTVLGAEGKAGIAEIMEAARYIAEHPDFTHGELYFVFTPDEELGYSTEYINMEKIPAKYGYTVDEGGIGELNYENFNAGTASITINGVCTHPGQGKEKMRNAILLASEFIQCLPENETPATTAGYEGYYHISDILGGVDTCRMTCNIRDFDTQGYEKRKAFIRENVRGINERYGADTIKVDIEDYYLNMKQKIDECPEIIEVAKKAMEQAGVTPVVEPIRGGTDGVTISFMGIPCPNIFSGCHNGQSIREFISVQTMEKSVEVILNIIQIFAVEGYAI